MSKNKKQFVSKAQERRARNWLAVRAFQRPGAGTHGCKKSKQNKNACRGKVSQGDSRS
jgi:hypothetical protein